MCPNRILFSYKKISKQKQMALEGAVFSQLFFFFLTLVNFFPFFRFQLYHCDKYHKQLVSFLKGSSKATHPSQI